MRKCLLILLLGVCTSVQAGVKDISWYSGAHKVKVQSDAEIWLVGNLEEDDVQDHYWSVTTEPGVGWTSPYTPTASDLRSVNSEIQYDGFVAVEAETDIEVVANKGNYAKSEITYEIVDGLAQTPSSGSFQDDAYAWFEKRLGAYIVESRDRYEVDSGPTGDLNVNYSVGFTFTESGAGTKDTSAIGASYQAGVTHDGEVSFVNVSWDHVDDEWDVAEYWHDDGTYAISPYDTTYTKSWGTSWTGITVTKTYVINEIGGGGYKTQEIHGTFTRSLAGGVSSHDDGGQTSEFGGYVTATMNISD